MHKSIMYKGFFESVAGVQIFSITYYLRTVNPKTRFCFLSSDHYFVSHVITLKNLHKTGC